VDAFSGYWQHNIEEYSFQADLENERRRIIYSVAGVQSASGWEGGRQRVRPDSMEARSMPLQYGIRLMAPLMNDLKGLEGLDFDVNIVCQQDDVSRPLSWVAVFDILLSALEDEENLVLAFECEDPMKRSKEMGE